MPRRGSSKPPAEPVVKPYGCDFLKLTNHQVENFSDCLRMGYTEQAFESIPQDVYESGLSVFKINSEGFPLISSMRQIISLSVRLDEPKFIVIGKEVGEGNDGEPLIAIENIYPVELEKEKLVNLIQDTLKRNFSNAKYNKDNDFGLNEVHCFYVEEEPEFCFNGWTFTDPVGGFDVSTGIKGRK